MAPIQEISLLSVAIYVGQLFFPQGPLRIMSANLSVFILALQVFCSLDCATAVQCYTCIEQSDWGDNNLYENCIQGGTPILKQDPNQSPPRHTEVTCDDGEICFILQVIDNEKGIVFVEKRCGDPEGLKCAQEVLGQSGDCLTANYIEEQKFDKECSLNRTEGQEGTLLRKRQESGDEDVESDVCYVVLTCANDYCNENIWTCESGGTGCSQK